MAEKISITAKLKVMNIGDEVFFPPENYRSVTVIASDYGFVSGRKYRVNKDREKSRIKVTRES